jgi:hypothetical protein
MDHTLKLYDEEGSVDRIPAPCANRSLRPCNVSKDKGVSWKLSTQSSSQVWERIIKAGSGYLLVGWEGAYALTADGESIRTGVIGGSNQVDFVSLASNGSTAVVGTAANALKGGDGKVDAQIWWASVAP